MTCPNCGLINPQTARRCDCGYDFQSSEMKTPYVPKPAPAKRSGCVTWLLVWFAIQGLFSLARGRSVDDIAPWVVAIIVCGGVGYALYSYFGLRGTQTTHLSTPGKAIGELVTEEVSPAVERNEPAEARSYEPGADDFFERYYTSPEPQRAPAALRVFLNHPRCQDPATNVTWYLFARIAQDHPFLLREYEKLFREAPEGRAVLLCILRQAGDEGTRTFLESCAGDAEFADLRAEIERTLENWSPGAIVPLSRPISTGTDLDLLWCEFRATGSTEPVRRIIDVFERPDHIRVKLVEWLHATSRPELTRYPLLARTTRGLLIRKLWKKASILCDPDRHEVLSSQDLDCHCTMTGWDVDRERAVRLAKLLPVPLYGEEPYIFLKASAR